jgi:hypothetical protein
MTKNQDPYATPSGGRGRRPPRKRGPVTPRDWSFSRGFWLKSIGIAAVVGLIGLSVTWPGGAERALVVGAATGVAAFVLLVASRVFLQRRSTAG